MTAPPITLTVIAGGPDTGKSLLAEALVAYRPQMMIARDHIRALMGTTDESAVTQATWDLARAALRHGVSVCAVGWNLEASDELGWRRVAGTSGAALRWVHVDLGRE